MSSLDAVSEAAVTASVVALAAGVVLIGLAAEAAELGACWPQAANKHKALTQTRWRQKGTDKRMAHHFSENSRPIHHSNDGDIVQTKGPSQWPVRRLGPNQAKALMHRINIAQV